MANLKTFPTDCININPELPASIPAVQGNTLMIIPTTMLSTLVTSDRSYQGEYIGNGLGALTLSGLGGVFRELEIRASNGDYWLYRESMAGFAFRVLLSTTPYTIGFTASTSVTLINFDDQLDSIDLSHVKLDLVGVKYFWRVMS